MSPNNTEIIKAVQGIKIREIPDPKLSVYHALASIAQLLAVKPENELKYEDRLALTDFLIQSYQSMTPKEMVIAVKMNLIGDLAPVKLPNGQTTDRVECFGRIDAQYLTHVFTEYQKAKQRAMLAFKAADEKLKDSIKPEKATPEKHLGFVIGYFEEHGQPPQFADWNMLFTYLWKNEKISSRELIPFKYDQEPAIKSELYAKLKTASTRSERAAIEIDLQENSINLELRKRFIAKWLTTIKIEDFREFIQTAGEIGKVKTT